MAVSKLRQRLVDWRTRLLKNQVFDDAPGCLTWAIGEAQPDPIGILFYLHLGQKPAYEKCMV
jgi:hypothetical protein